MKYHIIGIGRKSGEYEGKKYDNTYLYCTYPNDGVEGLAVVAVKVKTDRLNGQYAELLGKDVSFLYDQYRNVELVQVYK